MTDAAAAARAADDRAAAQPMDRRLAPVPPPPGRDDRVVLFVLIILFVSVGPLIWTIDPTYVDIRARNQAFAAAHPLGTDHLGRDLLARLMPGGQVSIAVGLTAMLHRDLHRQPDRHARGLLPPARRPADADDRAVPGAAAAAAAAPDRHPVPRDAAQNFGAGDRDLPADRDRHRRHQLDAGRPHRPRRGAGPEGARVRLGRALHRHAVAGASSCATSCRTCCRRSWSPPRSASRPRSSPRARCRFLGLGFPPDFPTWGRLLFDGADYMMLTPARVILPGSRSR